jgi:hypothetical protein
LSLPPHKHHHYIIHALPGLAPIVALGLARVGGWISNADVRRARWAGIALVVAGCAIVLVASTLAAALAPDFAADAKLLGAIGGLGLAAIGVAVIARGVVAIASLSFLTVLALLSALHSPYLPDRDLSAADRLFLRRIASDMPAEVRLFVTGRQPLARHLFYLDRPARRAEGIWRPEDVARLVRPGETVLVVTRAEDEPALAKIGAVERLDASARTRSERVAGDRYTLFRLTAR